jgi:phosphatidylglycerophosphatase A
MKKFLTVMVCSVAGVGFLPFIPGTFGSAAGIGVFLLVKESVAAYAAVLAAVIALGLFFGGEAEKVFKRKDPKYVVIDEVAGMLISLVFLPFYNVLVISAAFILFRALDTVKIFPAEAVQDKHGSIGIMGDDIIAGVYTNLVLQAVLRLITLSGS